MTRLVLILLAATLVVGQLWRLPLPGQGGGLLLSDIASGLVILAAAFYWFTSNRKKNYELRITNYALFLILNSIFVFILWSLFTLVIRVPDLGLTSSLVAAAYWLRLITHLLLLPALVILFQSPQVRRFSEKLLLITIGTLVALGFLQLVIAPDLNGPVLRSLGGGGWDPHQGRLFSTWLDPNLFGGFLVVVLPWLAGAVAPQSLLIPDPSPHLRRRESERHLSASGERSAAGRVRWYLLVLIFLSLIALLLTQSRTSFIALAGGVAALSPFLIWRLRYVPARMRVGLIAAAAVSLTIGLLALGLAFPNRLMGIFTIDDTAQLRRDSLASAWQLAQDHAWLGVGYNAYQFAAEQAGLIQTFALHSRAGSDNSWLTLWVTTGLPGVILFLAVWAAVAWQLARRALFEKNSVALAGLVSLLALFLHSQFVNSFLYSHLLITLSFVIAFGMTDNKNPNSQ